MPEGGGGQGQADHHGVPGQSRRHQGERGGQPDDQRDPPSGGGQPEGSAPDLLEVELVAGQEDEEGQAEIGQPGDHVV